MQADSSAQSIRPRKLREKCENGKFTPYKLTCYTLYQNKWPRQNFYVLHNYKKTFVRMYVPVWMHSVSFNLIKELITNIHL